MRRQALWVAAISLLSVLLWFAAPAFAGAAGVSPPVMTDGRYPPLRLFPEHVAAIEAEQDRPVVGASSALLVDLDSSTVLFDKNAGQALPPASTVKIMTALVVLRQAQLDDEVRVSEAAAATPGSRMGLAAGETLTVRDLLYGLLLPSGNDAAVALAEHVGGSEAGFVALMNEAAQELGMEEAHFVNVHGLDAEGQKMSAADLLDLTRAALEYPIFAEIVGTSAAEVAGHSLANTNELLGVYPDADGVKTGTTDLAGECLVATVNHDGRRTVAIVLGSPDRYSDVRAMLDYARASWRWGDLSLTGAGMDWESGADGQTHRLKVLRRDSVFLPAWQWTLAQPVRALQAGSALTGTAPVGVLRLDFGADTLATAPMGVWHAP